MAELGKGGGIARNMPCPSLKKRWPNLPLEWDWVVGKPGYELYPTDEPSTAHLQKEL